MEAFDSGSGWAWIASEGLNFNNFPQPRTPLWPPLHYFVSSAPRQNL